MNGSKCIQSLEKSLLWHSAAQSSANRYISTIQISFFNLVVSTHFSSTRWNPSKKVIHMKFLLDYFKNCIYLGCQRHITIWCQAETRWFFLKPNFLCIDIRRQDILNFSCYFTSMYFYGSYKVSRHVSRNQLYQFAIAKFCVY